MPTYEYKCQSCGHQFEKFQSITAAPIRRCPKCGKMQVRRLIGTGAGLIFKGSGFYITDYRDASYKEKAKAETGDSKPGASDSGKSETKTEAKADAKHSSMDAASKEAKPQTKHAAKHSKKE